LERATGCGALLRTSLTTAGSRSPEGPRPREVQAGRQAVWRVCLPNLSLPFLPARPADHEAPKTRGGGGWRQLTRGADRQSIVVADREEALVCESRRCNLRHQPPFMDLHPKHVLKVRRRHHVDAVHILHCSVATNSHERGWTVSSGRPSEQDSTTRVQAT
jgi:hypothetical protein